MSTLSEFAGHVDDAGFTSAQRLLEGRAGVERNASIVDSQLHLMLTDFM
jgi:hypothetical protein